MVRNRPEASSENLVEKLQQFKQRFQETIEVCFGVVLIVVFGIVSRWFQCEACLLERIVMVTSFDRNCCTQPVCCAGDEVLSAGIMGARNSNSAPGPVRHPRVQA